jgi:hypothetical protein
MRVRLSALDIVTKGGFDAPTLQNIELVGAHRKLSKTGDSNNAQEQTHPTSHLPEDVVKGDEVGLGVDTVRV